jgi:ubiquinone/menaquinone biosynthesis C-methylase UbiE
VRRLALLVAFGTAAALLWRRWSLAMPLVGAPGRRVLVLGAGRHALAVAAAVAPGGTVELVDPRREALDRTLTAAADAGLDGIVATVAPADALPFGDGSIDAALVAVRGEAALAEARRVVAPGGSVVSRY